MRREDTKPWYRQFWPWFIIALPASAVVGSLTTLWIAVQTSDSLVLRSEDGVRNASDRRIAAERFASELGLAVRLDIDLASGAVRAVMHSGNLDDVPVTLDLELSHPAFADRDLTLELTRARPDADGHPVWVGHFVRIPAGRYYAVLRAGEAWRLTAEWNGESSLALRPGGEL